MLEHATDADDTAAELEELQARLSESHPTAQIAGLSGLLAADATPSDDAPPPGPSKAGRVVSRALAVGLSLLVLAIAAVTATVLLNDDRKAPSTASDATSHSSSSKSPSTSRTSSAAQPVGPILIKAAQDFDPQGDGSEKPDEVPDAVDGDLVDRLAHAALQAAGPGPQARRRDRARPRLGAVHRRRPRRPRGNRNHGPGPHRDDRRSRAGQLRAARLRHRARGRSSRSARRARSRRGTSWSG